MNPFNREEHAHRVDRELLYMILETQFLIFQKLSEMQTDVQALIDNEAKLKGLLEQFITLFQQYQQQVQNGIDSQDLAAIQATNTALAGDIANLQAALPAPAPAPAPVDTPPAQ